MPKDVKPKRRRPSKAEQRAETMEQILDAAEALFSKHGLYGVTLKDVAGTVGVHHSLLNYYFEDKIRIVRRRICPQSGDHQRTKNEGARRI